MNIYLLIAGILCFLLGLVHSILGESLIFQNKRKSNNLIPTIVKGDLKERHLRIIWATWHLASIFGWALGAIIIIISIDQDGLNSNLITFLSLLISCFMFIGSVLVMLATKGKHPGWVVLLAISILLLLGRTM